MDLLATCAGCAVVVALLTAGCGGDGEPQQPAHAVTIHGRTWRVELALTPQERYRGLGGRKSLAEDAGMLFVFRWPEVLDFCMRDCFIPLDVAFIGADMRVVKMHTMAVEPDALGTVPYPSELPAQYALEVPAGALGRAGVKVGDLVAFSPGIPSAAKGSPAP